MKRIYVGNLPFSATEEELNTIFGEYGEVSNVDIIMDRQTGRSRGFGFVEMGDDDGRTAIAELNGNDFGGRQLKINEANERPRRAGGGRY